MLYERVTDMRSIFSISCLVGIIFVIRLVIYSIGFTQSQIGGAGVSKNIRLGLGDKLRRIPLSGFTQKREGQYINIMTADVNTYKKWGSVRYSDCFCLCTIFPGCSHSYGFTFSTNT